MEGGSVIIVGKYVTPCKRENASFDNDNCLSLAFYVCKKFFIVFFACVCFFYESGE